MGKLSRAVNSVDIDSLGNPSHVTDTGVKVYRLKKQMEEKKAQEAKQKREQTIRDRKEAEKELAILRSEKRLKDIIAKQEADRVEKEESEKRKEASDYKEIIEKNRKRDNTYVNDKMRDKDFEKVTPSKPKESHKNISINTAVKSLRF